MYPSCRILGLVLFGCSGIVSAPPSTPPATTVPESMPTSSVPAPRPDAVPPPAAGASGPPAPPDPAAPSLAPTFAAITGTWPRLSGERGQEFVLTQLCAAEPLTVTVKADAVEVNFGQEGETFDLVGTPVTTGERLSLALRTDARGSLAETVRREGDAWVWEGEAFDGWRTAAREGAYPSRKECCAPDEDGMMETYATVSQSAECPPPP